MSDIKGTQLRPSISELQLELYRRIHDAWLLTPFALRANILLADTANRQLRLHHTWRLNPIPGYNLPDTINFGEDVTGRSARDEALVYEPNTNNLPATDYLQIMPGTQSVLAVPAMTEWGELIAIVRVDSPRLRAFDDLDDEKLFLAYAKSVAHEVSNIESHNIDQKLSFLEVRIELAYLLERFLRPIYRAIRLLDPEYQINLFLADEARRELMLYQSGFYYPIEKPVLFIPYGQGVTGQAAILFKPIYVGSVKSVPPERYVELTHETNSNFAVPIRSDRGELLGVINIEHKKEYAFPEKNRQLIEDYCSLAATAIQTAERLHRDEQDREFAHAIQQLDHTIIVQTSPKKICDLIVENAVKLTAANFGSLQLIDEQEKSSADEVADGYLVMISAWPSQELSRLSSKPILVAEGVTGEVAKNKSYRWVPDVHQRADYIPSVPGIQTELAVPLLSGDELVGVLNVEWPAGARPEKKRCVDQLSALADIAVLGLSETIISGTDEITRAAQDKTAITLQFATKILHDSLPTIKLARKEFSESRHDIEDLGDRIELILAKRKNQRDEMLHDLLKTVNSMIEADEALQHVQQGWENFREKVATVSAVTRGGDNQRVSVDEAISTALASSMSNGKLSSAMSVLCDVAEHLPKPMLGNRLSTILEILIDNAGEAMINGGQLIIRARRWREDLRFVEIEIEDSGPGIPVEIRERVFEPFFSWGKKGNSIRGLGLYFARLLAEISGGDLTLINTSESKSGAVFSLRLPINRKKGRAQGK